MRLNGLAPYATALRSESQAASFLRFERVRKTLDPLDSTIAAIRGSRNGCGKQFAELDFFPPKLWTAEGV